MAFFNDDNEVYQYVGGAFELAADHDEVGPKFAASSVTLRICCTDPEAQLTVSMHEPKMTVAYGDDDRTPDITLFMPADTADKFWRGEYNLAVGLAKRQVKAKGPVNKILKLVPLTKHVFPLYQREVAAKSTGPRQSRLPCAG